MSLYVSSASSSASVSSTNNTPTNIDNDNKNNEIGGNSSNNSSTSNIKSDGSGNSKQTAYSSNNSHSSLSSSSSKSSNSNPNLNLQLSKMMIPTYDCQNNMNMMSSSSPTNIFSLDNFLNEANLLNSVYLHSHNQNNDLNNNLCLNNNDQTIANISLILKNKLENLITSYMKQTSDNNKAKNFDESFVSELFNLIYSINFKIGNFRSIFNEIDQSNLMKNIFLVIARVGHECFRLSLYTACEYLLDFVLSNIETQSSRLKMAALSTLSACYWRLGKFNESINFMNLELTLATRITYNDSTSLNSNKYRIYGNLASAYQQLNNQNECLQHYNMQLNVAIEMNNNLLTINTLNSLGLFYNGIKDFTKSIKYFEEGLNCIEKGQSEFTYETSLKLNLKQLSLIAEFYLKTSNYEKSKNYYLKLIDINLKIINQLIISSFNSGSSSSFTTNNNDAKKTNNDDIIGSYLQECVALLNLGLICSKLKIQKESVEYYEKCLNNLQMNLNYTGLNLKMKSYKANYQKIIELYGRVYIGLINNYVLLNDDLRASLYAHSMLDFTLKEYVKLKDDEKINELDYYDYKSEESSTDPSLEYGNRYKYLKFLELTACSKVAIWNAKQERLNDALKV
jgi:tetratricopeptide (TPR) repeat protein